MLFNFNNTYADKLDGFYTPVQSAKVPKAKIIKVNTELAAKLGLNLNNLSKKKQTEIFSGNIAPDGASPIAQVYAGHQFGGFVPQLGDGRALLLGEIIDDKGARFDIQLKGSGRTPYSRAGDGKSALGPVLREYIVSEAMYALGIPSTRALAAVTTGENVMRNQQYLPSAVFTRVAASHIRVGTFQYFAARGEINKVQQLADYTIDRHYPNIKQEANETENPYLSLLIAITDAQASLVAQWMCVGFIHGVMNTDNMTVSGETIDYGPCAFMDYYSPDTVFSSIDRHGRYAYQNQPPITQWNLARLAETLLPLIDENKEHAIELATNALDKFPEKYTEHWLAGMRAKIGLSIVEENDLALINDLLAAMDGQQVDFTLLFRNLVDLLQGQEQEVYAQFKDASLFKVWVERWRERLSHETQNTVESIQLMYQKNPIYIPRNHKVEEALEAAVSHADYSKFEVLINTLSNPYQPQEGKEEYTQPAPNELSVYKTFCGT